MDSFDPMRSWRTQFSLKTMRQAATRVSGPVYTVFKLITNTKFCCLFYGEPCPALLPSESFLRSLRRDDNREMDSRTCDTQSFSSLRHGEILNRLFSWKLYTTIQ